MEFGLICGSPVWCPGSRSKGIRLLNTGTNWWYDSTWHFCLGLWTSKLYCLLKCPFTLQWVWVWLTM